MFLLTVIQVKANIYNDPKLHEFRTVPDTHPLEYLSARDLGQVGDTDGAFKRFRRSFKSYPYHRPTIREYLQLVLDRHGSESLQSLVRDHFRRTGSSELFRSFFSQARGDTSTYRQVLRWLDRKNPDPQLRRIRVRILLNERRYDRVKELIRDGLERFPGDRRLALWQAEVLAHQSRCEKAYRRVRAIVNQYPGWGRPYALQYRLLKGGDKQIARKIRDRYKSLTGADSLPNQKPTMNECAVEPQELSEQSS